MPGMSVDGEQPAEIVTRTLAATLEQWIEASRNETAGGAMPVPRKIREALTGYIDDDVMDAARFRIGDTNGLNLAGLFINYGDANAVTLIDVVVFKSEEAAYNDAALWAHELTHVKQYRDWGLHDFALRYVRNYHDVEAPAYSAQAKYVEWRAARSYSRPQ